MTKKLSSKTKLEHEREDEEKIDEEEIDEVFGFTDTRQITNNRRITSNRRTSIITDDEFDLFLRTPISQHYIRKGYISDSEDETDEG
ncbi:unnamed protein product [Rhizophagus irregularis]|nr:unnamed protein product [Rhizophagus irregularis]